MLRLFATPKTTPTFPARTCSAITRHHTPAFDSPQNAASRSPGAASLDLFQQGNNIPVIACPIVNHDDNQHAANENVRLQNLWDGIEIFAASFGSL